jgi:DNA-binding response OmpR family regulator
MCLEEENGETAVTCLSSGDLAALAMTSEQFDFAVVEAILPEVCGFELAERAASRSMPVLMMSGDFIAQDTLEKYGYPHLAKPFPLRELIAEARRINLQGAENVERLKVAGAKMRAAVEGA